ncbi:MAG TPA: glutamyl-tRNA reductase, partial [Vicinamibacteria bacterium]|nr:glutamyl-tRNA reductase [Vicinamibacteria bacterium]
MIIVIGVSHRTAPLPVREALAFPKDQMRDALLRLRAETGAGEAMILSTCNRVELYARQDDPGAVEALESFLARYHSRDGRELHAVLYRYADAEAIRHAFRVAASLESMVIGEPQILGQVKEAYQAAEEAGTLGSALNALRNRTLAAAKRVRTETGIGRNAVSVSYVAVELARKIFGELKDKNVLLVGAGKMSELAAKHLVRSGGRATVLGGRTFEKAAELAAALGGKAAPFESLRDELARTDIVISGTGAPGLVIHPADVESARAARRGRHARPLFLIDIAVPRDIDPAVRKIGGVFLYDLDDLKAVAEANVRERLKEAAAAEALVEREVRDFLDWQKAREAVPLLNELRRRAEEIRRHELDKAKRRIGPLTPEQDEA